MSILLKLYVGDGPGIRKLNKALIVLIPKKLDAEEVGHFWLISLVHSFAKLFATMLGNQARRCMQEIVGLNQSTFVQGRNLHANFILVRQVVVKIHARKEAALFLKLDISRAFDSLSWSFPFEVLHIKFFGMAWMRWIAIPLQSSCTKVVVNGIPEKKIAYVCGMRQRDPIFPFLFVMAMEALTDLSVK